MSMTEQLPIRRWNVDEFDQMSHIGILSPAGYELLDGVVHDTNGYVRLWSVRDYDRMAEAGLITAEEHAELIEGHVVQPLGFRWTRAYVRMWLGHLLQPAAGKFGIVSQVGHLMLDDGTMVHPAIKVLRRKDDFYADRYPGADDVLLVVEVLNPLAQQYVNARCELYARHAVPEYWLVDLERGAVRVHLTPDAAEYRDVREYRYDVAFESPALRGYKVRLADVLRPER
jgi:hypothetical protein